MITAPTFYAPVRDVGTLRLKWTKIVGAAGYRLSKDGSEIYTGSETSYNVTGLRTNKPYTFTINAYTESEESDTASLNAWTDSLFLITDRTGENVSRLTQLAAKGWRNMMAAERLEYLFSETDTALTWADGEVFELADGVCEVSGVVWEDNTPLEFEDGIASLFDAIVTNKGAYNVQDVNRVSKVEAYIKKLYDDFPTELEAYLNEAKQHILDSLIADEKYYTLKNPLLPDSLAKVPYTYPIPLKEIKTDWEGRDFIADGTKEPDITYYLYNLALIRALVEYPADTPPVPITFWQNPTPTKANDIERILLDAFTALDNYAEKTKAAIDEAEENEVNEYARTALSWLYSNEIFTGET